MARTIKEIANGMKADFIGNESLCDAFGLTYDADRTEGDCITYYDANFNSVCVETCLIYIVATCAAALENIYDWFREDVDRKIAEERYGHKGWYESTAKAAVINGDKIITHASCEEMNFGIRLKVAKGAVGSLVPLSTSIDNDELGAFQAYMNALKPAGIPIVYVNTVADELGVDIVVYYDPVRYTSQLAVTNAVENAITHYLQSIDFNGVFTTMELTDALQKVEGLDVIRVNGVEARHGGYSFASIENNARYQPYAGYMTLSQDPAHKNITVIANN